MKDQLELDDIAEPKHNGATGRSEFAAAGVAEGSLPSVTIGRLVALELECGPMVDFAMNNTGDLLPARTVVPVDQVQVGAEVALVFEDGEVTRPIIVGVMQDWNAPRPDRLKTIAPAGSVEVRHDDQSLLLTAGKEITLQCGKASITLTSAGKLLLRGAYLLSRSSGVNRIKGGSVQIN